MKLILRPSLRTFKVITISALLSFILLYLLIIDDHYFLEVENLKNYVYNHKKFNHKLSDNLDRKDWHDWQFIKLEKERKGPGENGQPFDLTDPADIELNDKLFKIEGLYVVVSDKISVNRSVPDTRLPQ